MRGEPLEPSTQSRVSVGGHVFSVGPRSFWQSHRDAPSMLLDAVLELTDAQADDHVTDLFSGVGLFAVPLAKVVGPGGRVTAVESSPYAVRDARQNAEGLRNLKVREWSVTPRSVNDSVSEGDLVVLDPPRAGLAKGVAETLVRRRPRRLTYVSCDAATFARDLKILLSGGFVLSEIRAFDLFPMTEHVELVASLDFTP
jgi:tRNA/tmRNA/rRNA uracil-C5-methylase (TrmA/RlmC/RlmD family)